MGYKIEKNIALVKHQSKQTLPFEDMEVNDSFQAAKEFNGKEVTRIAVAAKRYGDKQDPVKVFKVRKYEGGIRVWRTV